MANTMAAAVLRRPREIRVEERPVPEPRPGEVLVQLGRVGVCGSDIHWWRTGSIGGRVIERPLVLGHECAGVIVAVGQGIDPGRVGERVAVEPGVPCRRCRFCKAGRYNLCPAVVFFGVPHVDGALTEYVTVAADFAHLLPDRVTLEEGAMMEPLAVGLAAVGRGEVAVREAVLVLGAGTVGLMTVAAAKARGAAPVIAVDISPFRLEWARRMGADLALDARADDVAAIVAGQTDGYGPDVVIETAGTPRTTQQTIELASRGGRAVWVGLPEEATFPIDMVLAVRKELDIRGVFRYVNVFPKAIELVASGAINVRPLVTHTYALDETQEAVAFADSHKDEALKVMIALEDAVS